MPLLSSAERALDVSHTQEPVQDNPRRTGDEGEPTIAEVPPGDVERPDRTAEIGQAPETDPFKPRIVGPYNLNLLVLLMPAAIFGLLARLGIQALGTYDGQSVFSLAWVQCTGCFVMGLCLGVREPLSGYYPELYTALTSGFCGSLTTFSSWQLDVFLSWTNGHTSPGYQRIWIYDVMDGLTRLLFTLAISLSATAIGFRISADHLAPVLGQKINTIRSPLSPFYHTVMFTLSLASYIAVLPLYFVLSPSYRPMATSALLFAFPGALLRYLLSTLLNRRQPSFPLGTFSANMTGTFLLGLFYTLERIHPLAKDSELSTTCVMLKGLSDGFTGCLTTISTFVVELRTLKNRDAQNYCFWSVLIAQALMVIIVGSARWSGHIGTDSGCYAYSAYGS